MEAICGSRPATDQICNRVANEGNSHVLKIEFGLSTNR